MLTLRFRSDFFGKLGTVIVQELDGILAQFQGLWRTEHNEDGTHAGVTATSLAVTGRVRLTAPTTMTLDATMSPFADVQPLHYDTMTMLRIDPVGAVVLSGIQAAGRKTGDVVVVVNVTQGTDTVSLSLHDSASRPGNRFAGNISTSPELVDISPGRMVLLMYDAEGVGAAPVWRVHQT